VKLEEKYFFPMVCFCDIPYNVIGPHIKEYGSYGIALYKSWGKKNGINPILYAHRNSIVYKSFRRQFKSQLKINTIAVEDNHEKIKGIVSKSLYDNVLLLSHVKPYEGMNRTGKVKRFYDEKEWRYVPRRSSELFLSKNQILNNNIEVYNNVTLADRLKFKPKNIKYIILPNINEKNRLSKSLNNMNFTKVQKINLMSKLMTKSELKGTATNS
jgi:hypothetical protein